MDAQSRGVRAAMRQTMTGPNGQWSAMRVASLLVTAVVLIISSMRKSKKHAQPAGCGINYFREER